MNLSWIDWTIVAIAIVALRYISLTSSRHMKGVADFLSANRCAGRYLLTIAGQMGGTGVISLVAVFEMYYQVGLPPNWWGLMSIPVGIIMLITGWVYWRFRETRALTLAQFFEMRYSRRFRVFAGFICWASGIINFGIFPAVAARFFIYFCGLPDYFRIPYTEVHVSMFASIMAVDLALALVFVTQGGQISVMITEFFQGMFCGFAFLVIAGFLLYQFPWSLIVGAMNTAPPDASMLNPYHTTQAKDFNIWYFLIGIFSTVYNSMSWQGSSGFQGAAKSPHEARMGGIIGMWRGFPLSVMIIMLSLVAFAVMTLPQFVAIQATVKHVLAGIQDDTIRKQMTVPVAIAHILPTGIKGLITTAMLFFSFTCHDTYMHSWGSIFIQDVYMPLRKTPMTPKQHIRYLRFSIIGVAIFAFLFSLCYPQNSKILFFFVGTGMLWLGGAGAVIIGGLYWKRGTTVGAYVAVIVGIVFGTISLTVPPLYKYWYKADFPIDNQWLYCFAMGTAFVSYVIVSLLTHDPKNLFNLDKMLNRGIYALTDQKIAAAPTREHLVFKILGINKDFTFTDKIWAVGLLTWNTAWFVTFFVVTAIHYLSKSGISDLWWSRFWYFNIALSFFIGVPATIWFSIGGIRDIRELFHTLDHKVRDHSDDGRVVHELQKTHLATVNDLPKSQKENH
ncbi:MAG: sodium:solute symporter [Phycisphaerae bacterium]